MAADATIGYRFSTNEHAGRSATMTRTRVLLAILVLVILLQLFPGRAADIKIAWVSAAAVYVLVWSGLKFRVAIREKSRLTAQEAADAEEYQQYKNELDAIRAQHDAQRDLSDPTEISPEYRAALAALHDRHQAMLERKFGSRA
jgi:hypothetical protein